MWSRMPQQIYQSINFYCLFECFFSILTDCIDQSSPVLLDSNIPFITNISVQQPYELHIHAFLTDLSH